MDVSFREFGIRAYDDHNIAVGRYLIMPDHLHLFVSGPGDFQLGRWVGTLKQFLARRILIGQSVEPFWQRGFFDHVLRNDESYGKKWDYVRANPVAQWGSRSPFNPVSRFLTARVAIFRRNCDH